MADGAVLDDLRAQQAAAAAEARRLFQEATQGYWEAVRHQRAAMLAAADARRRLREAREELADIEASLRLSPEVQDGRNAEERAAKLRLALKADGAHDRAQRDLSRAEDELARAEAELEEARATVAGLKRQMDWATTLLRYLAKEEE